MFDANHFVIVAEQEEHLSKGKAFSTYWFLFLKKYEIQEGEDGAELI